jgi:hypothetical protein
MTRATPKRQPGQGAGRHKIDGAFLDLAGAAAFWGLTQKALRARVSQGLVPYRRLGGRLIFIKREVEQFYSALPGVTPEEAHQNQLKRDKA